MLAKFGRVSQDLSLNSANNSTLAQISICLAILHVSHVHIHLERDSSQRRNEVVVHSKRFRFKALAPFPLAATRVTDRTPNAAGNDFICRDNTVSRSRGCNISIRASKPSRFPFLRPLASPDWLSPATPFLRLDLPDPWSLSSLCLFLLSLFTLFIPTGRTRRQRVERN